MNVLLCEPPRKSLGWIADVLNTAGSVTNTLVSAKSQEKATDAMLQNALIQTDAQRELARQETERLDKILKATMIGGGVLIAGLIVYSLSKK